MPCRGAPDFRAIRAPLLSARTAAMPQESLSFATLVAYIRRLCQEKRTGTLFIMSDNHLQGQISIQNGEIVFLFSHGKRDLNALPLLLNIKSGTVNFSKGVVPIKTTLPATADILEYLANASVNATFTNGDELLFARPLSTSAKTVLEQALKEFIGPIASLVCADHFRTVVTLDAAIEALADEIPTPAAAARFRELARQRLG